MTPNPTPHHEESPTAFLRSLPLPFWQCPLHPLPNRARRRRGGLFTKTLESRDAVPSSSQLDRTLPSCQVADMSRGFCNSPPVGWRGSVFPVWKTWEGVSTRVGPVARFVGVKKRNAGRPSARSIEGGGSLDAPDADSNSTMRRDSLAKPQAIDGRHRTLQPGIGEITAF